MLRSYLIAAWRHLARHRSYSAINLAGLSVGVSFCLLAWQFVAFERSFDRFHEKADRVFRVTRTIVYPDREWVLGTTQKLVGEYIEADLPQVVETARLLCSRDMDDDRVIRWDDETTSGILIAWADPELFEILSFAAVEGDPAAALTRPDHIVLGGRAARLLYSEDEAVGREISLRDGSEWRDFTIGAVVEIPSNSTYDFDLLLPFELGPNRGGSYVHTLVEVGRPEDGEVLQRAMPAFGDRHFGDRIRRTRESRGAEYDERYALQPLTAMHLDPSVDNTAGSVSPTQCWVLMGIAAALLLIACANFVNLSMAMAGDRFREVGLRKTLGAYRGQVARQFLVESLLFVGAALALGIALAEAALPTFSALVDRSLTIEYATLWQPLLATAALLAVLTGAYPALALSRPHPAGVLRGQLQITGNSRLGRALVAAQLGLSVLLVVVAVTMARQMEHVLTRDLGYDREQVVVINSGSIWDRDRALGVRIRNRYHDLAASHADVVSASASWLAMTQSWHRGMGLNHEGMQTEVELFPVDYDFAATLGLNMLEGRDFSREFPGDQEGSIIVNETLLRRLGWESGVDESLAYRRGERTVVGVFGDFHFQSLHHEVEPLVLELEPEASMQHLYVRIDPDHIGETLALLKGTWEEVAPELPFRFSFLDEEVDRQYRQEQRLGRIVNWGSGLAVVIASLGALALASLAALRRTKEIGIRKALGATSANVMDLLSREFAWLGVIAIAIAWPIAYLACDRWLGNFAWRIELGVEPFVAGAALVVGTTLLVVISQALRASLMDPVEALRYE